MSDKKQKKPGFFYCVGLMLGKSVSKTLKNDISERVIQIYENKPKGAEVIKLLKAEKAKEKNRKNKNKWRNRRWGTLLFINLLFVVSYFFDMSVLEGALTASRFMGFHMADLNSALQITLASKMILINLVIGFVTVLIMWIIFGGRTFCSWVCPYHLIAEFAEFIHLKLAQKGIVSDHAFNRKVRTVFYIVFLLLAFLTGYTVFEVISPTGILSRALIYGPTFVLLWVVFLLMIEILYSRRMWCRYVCPIGLTYGFVGIFSIFRVNYNINDCLHEGDCRKVCLVPHVLEWTIKNRSFNENQELGPDCTRCGACVDICPTNSLTFKFKGISREKYPCNDPEPKNNKQKIKVDKK
ncbi:MAG: NapH/MauN family ferredoxin-type protein [Gammaproteobacteria bacterium]|nr:MAG: NapH/MauN family ferredoxin-type protein [Gammaproteobacteria bacterium]